jgi:transposase
MAATCRYYGNSRNVFYRWKCRYEDEGLEGLKDRSSAPLYCPTVTHPDVVEKIIHLRQHYHFGPMKIRMYLKRYHDVEISASGVWRILKRLGMNRLPASQRKRHTDRWKRYEKQRPGHYVQIDVKFIEPITTGSGRRKRYYQYTATDDCTRLRVLRAYPRFDQKTAIQFLDYVLSRLPFQVEKIQTDRNFSPASTGTCLIRASVISTSGRPPPGSTEKSSVHTASTPKSSTDCSTVSSKTTPACSTRNSGSGRTITTTTSPTADSEAKHRTKDCYKRPRLSLSPATVSHTPSRWITSVSPDQPQSTWSPPQNWEMRSCTRWLRQHRSRRSLRTVLKRSTPAIVLSHVHPGVAILLAAVWGGLITVLVGIARMFRLRRAAKKNLKALTSRR